jgi:hypothetical protein
MLTSTDLAGMRAAVNDLLPDTANILAGTVAPDGQGGWSQTWGTATAGVKCRLDPGRKENRESVAGAALLPFSWWQLTLPYDTTLTEQNRVEIAGETFNVVHVDTGKSWSVSVRAVLTKV